MAERQWQAGQLQDPGVTAGIILAAGMGSRMGRTKQLVQLAGRPMLAHVLENCCKTALSPLVLVLGHGADQIQEQLPPKHLASTTIIFNPDYASGMASSVGTGLKALNQLRPDAPGALFVLGDQPTVGPEIITSILTAARGRKETILIPRFNGRQGNPVYFGRAFFPELSALSGDRGGRALFARHPEALTHVDIPSEDICLDLDSPADLNQITTRFKEIRP